jgi:exopolysaccharide biosynthesis operon protein EpsL
MLVERATTTRLRGMCVLALTVAGASIWAPTAAIGAPVTYPVEPSDDRLELFASEVVTWDDNLFRISKGVDPAPLSGTSSLGDWYRTTSFGFNVDVPVRRQRFFGGLRLFNTRYDRFTVLDLDDGHDGQALWLWQIGKALEGQLGYTNTLTQSSFANVQSGVQVRVPNFIETEHAFFTTRWQPMAGWQMRGEVGRVWQSNSAVELQLSDAGIDNADLTVSRLTRAGSELGLSMRITNGDLPNEQLIAGMPVDNSYEQRDVAVVLDWPISEISRVTARAGRTRRSYTDVGERDFDGWTWRAALEWNPIARFALTAIAQNDISTTEEVNVGFVLVKGIMLYPTMTLNSKIDVTAGIELSDRDYLGDAGVVLGTIPPRSERLRAALLKVSYRPVRSLTVNLAWRREARRSDAAFADYDANVVSAGVRLGF